MRREATQSPSVLRATVIHGAMLDASAGLTLPPIVIDQPTRNQQLPIAAILNQRICRQRGMPVCLFSTAQELKRKHQNLCVLTALRYARGSLGGGVELRTALCTGIPFGWLPFLAFNGIKVLLLVLTSPALRCGLHIREVVNPHVEASYAQLCSGQG